MLPTLRISLLGDFLLMSGDPPVAMTVIPRVQALLAYLALHRDAPQERSHLAFLLWPDSTEVQAHTNLRKLLHQLRQALPDVDSFLRIETRSLQWQPACADACWTLDLFEFEQTLAQTKQAQDASTLRQTLERVLHLYRGDLLPTCYDEWILPERDRLRQDYLRASEHVIALAEQERDYATAITVAQHLLRADPLHEATYRQLMRLYAVSDDRVAALRVYHTCATSLERELGVQPSKATRHIYESLVQMDTTFSLQTVVPASRTTGTLLVGRAQEWVLLQAAWQKSSRGHPHVALLSGEAGIGKTRLAEELVAWVSRQGGKTAVAHCYAAEGRLAYAPIISWLRTDAVQKPLAQLDERWLSEIARLDPDLLKKYSALSPSTPITQGWQRQHLFEALAHALLCTHQPFLLLLDDLQWCDSETLEWLHYLLRFDSSAPILLMGTVRSEEILPEDPLVTLLGTWQRGGLMSEIALSPLSAGETTSLAEQVAGKALDSLVAKNLYDETEGNPLFVVEMVRAATAARQEARFGRENCSDGLLPLLVSPTSTLPPTVQTVLSARLVQLSPIARQLAQVAAVIGREFRFAVLACASGESEDIVVQGLDELWRRRIVREQGTELSGAYDFSHDKLRVQAYTSLSAAHRRLLHHRVAEAYKTVYAGDLDSVSRHIASHYEQAALARQAIPWYERAGRAAVRIFANAEAITAFQHALALLATNPHNWEERATLSLALGDVFAAIGQQQDARCIYQDALTFVPAHDYLRRARLLRKAANTWNVASSNPLDTFHAHALQSFQQAEALLEQADERSDVAWISEWIDLQIAQLLPLRGSVEEMTATIEKVRPLLERYGTGEQRGQFLQAVGSRDSKRDRYIASEETIREHRAALTAVQQTGNSVLIGFSHFSLGNHLCWVGRLAEAEQEMHAAISLAEQTGNTRLLARCLLFLPCVFRRGGQVEEVRALVMRALTVPEARYADLLKGHQAWLAWRTGNPVEAERAGRLSLEEQSNQQEINAFRWMGVWPLIGALLAQKKLAESIQYIRMLLDPTQQPPPQEIEVLLTAALKAWERGQQEEAHALLQQTILPAKGIGYL